MYTLLNYLCLSLKSASRIACGCTTDKLLPSCRYFCSDAILFRHDKLKFPPKFEVHFNYIYLKV